MYSTIVLSLLIQVCYLSQKEAVLRLSTKYLIITIFGSPDGSFNYFTAIENRNRTVSPE